MSKATENLGLFEYEPDVDGAQTFNIETALNENWEKLDEAVSDKAEKPTYTTGTLSASGWSGSTYSFEAQYPHTDYDIAIEVAPTATADQFEAFGAAMICGSVTSNVITALGDVPTDSIPIIIKAVMK